MDNEVTLFGDLPLGIPPSSFRYVFGWSDPRSVVMGQLVNLGLLENQSSPPPFKDPAFNFPKGLLDGK